MLYKELPVIVLVQSILVTSSNINSSPILNTRIVNGQRAIPSKFPWHARLRIRTEKGESLCGGSLISRSWVVTAAHCTDQAKRIFIELGIKNAVKHEFTTFAKKIIIHGNYSTVHLFYDISLIELWKPAPMTHLIQKILLPPPSLEDQLTPGLTGEVCGFGRINDNNFITSTSLLWLRVILITNEECAKTFGPTVVTDLKICANGVDPTQNICDGDSGGGLVVQLDGVKYLVGITSFSGAKKCAGVPAGYQRIIPLLDWINKRIK